MSAALDSFAFWLADFYLTTTVLLVAVLVALALLKQPARRLAISKAAFVALALLAVLCAIPGWSVVHLIAARESRAPMASGAHETSARATTAIQSFSAADAGLNDAVSPSVASGTLPQSQSRWPEFAWPHALAAVHAVGSSAVLVWLGLGALAARRLLWNAQQAPGELRSLLAQLVAPETRRVELLVSERIEVAAALGVMRPTVLLPTSWTEQRPYNELRTVLAHEVAHVCNADLAWLGLSRLLLVLLWALPLYWLLRRRLRLDQEVLADAAAAEYTSRQQYAEQLVAWARGMPARSRMTLPAAVGLWEGPSQLRRRVALLLDDRLTLLRECSRAWRSAATASAFVVALALSLVTIRPGTIAQTNPAGTGEDQASTGDYFKSGESKQAPEGTITDVFIPSTFVSTAKQGRDGRTPNTISGRCLDESGQPLADVETILFRINEADGALEQVAAQRTDADGRFEFSDVIDLMKEYPGGKVPNLPTDKNSFWQVVLRSPGRASTIWPLAAYDIAHNGSTRELKMPQAVALRGRLVGPDGAPVARAFVRATDSYWQPFDGAMSARTDAEGRYEIRDLAPFDMAEYRKARENFEAQMRAGKRDWDATSIPVQSVVVVTHPAFATMKSLCDRIPGTKDIQLQPAAVISGRVVYAESNRPAGGVAVQASNLGHSLFNFTEKATTDADGKFRFTTLPAGIYDVWADAAGWLNKGVAELKTTTELDTTTGEANVAPDIVLIRGGKVRVRLVDGATNEPLKVKPDDKAIIEVHPKNRLLSRTNQQRVAPDTGGIFEFRALPGQNWLFLGAVISDDDQLKWTQLRDEQHQQPIYATVVEGEAVTVNIPVTTIPQMAAQPQPILFNATLSEEAKADDKGDQGAEAKPTTTPKAARIVGRVTTQNGQPIAGVRVRSAVPAVDMRLIYPDGGAKYDAMFLAETGDDGRYEMELPASAEGCLVSVDAMKPGYARLADVGRSDGGTRYVTIAPGKDNDVSFSLKPGLYVKGVVVDEKGNPIVNAEINANAAIPGSVRGIESTGSGSDGSFEIFSFPVQPEAHDGQVEKGRIGISHADYVHNFIDDVYKLSEEERTSLKIVLQTGHQVSGVVLDADDKPVPNVIVESNHMAGGGKGVMTDDAGHFVIRGLVDGSYRIRVHAMSLHQRATVPLKLDSDYADLQIRLQPITLTKEPKTVNVLGMTLTDANKELKAAYDLFFDRGALILNPGKDSARLNIGELEEGDCFWMVGKKQISNVREFAENVLTNAEKQESGEYKCRVVYSFRRLNYLATSNTQYLELTERDLQSLRDFLANWPSE